MKQPQWGEPASLQSALDKKAPTEKPPPWWRKLTERWKRLRKNTDRGPR
jgi:hypothetical protein